MAELLHIHVNTLRSWERNGRLVPIRIGPRRDRRYTKEAVRTVYDAVPLQAPRSLFPALLTKLHIVLVVGAVLVSAGGALFWRLQYAGAQSGTSIVFAPTTCEGWSNADAARTLSVSGSAGPDQFIDSNSAVYVADASMQATSPLHCAWTSSAQAVDGQKKVSAASILVSLSSRAANDSTGVLVVRVSTNGTDWRAVRSVILRGETSNVHNDGYLRIPLEGITTVAQLRNIRVRLEPDLATDNGTGTSIRVDGVAVDATVASSHLTTAKLAPASCAGWSNAQAARTTDRRASDGWNAFSKNTSAMFQRSSAYSMGDATETAVSCGDFPVLRTSYGSTILNAKLSVSMAFRGSPSSDDIIVFEYSTDGGQSWTAFDSKPIRNEESNILNDGFWSVSLPDEVTREGLASLVARVRYVVGGVPTDSIVYVDGMSLDLTTQEVNDSSSPEYGFFSFLRKRYFLPIEEPTIFIDQDDLKSVDVRDASGHSVDMVTATAVTTVGAHRRIALSFTHMKSFRPGIYTAVLTIANGRKTVQETQTFSWGELSMNTPKSSYRVGDDVPVTLGVVNSLGATVCNADLDIRITKPDGTALYARTADGSLPVSTTCGPESVTANPDYLTRFKADAPGSYQVLVTTHTDAGDQQTAQTVDVVSVPQLVVERVGPSRINPRQSYLMHLYITPVADVTGDVSDSVPSSFSISQVSDSGRVDTHAGMASTVVWAVDWKAGKEYELTYAFDAPDQSPALYSLGPATVGGNAVGSEWLVASDQVIERSDPSVRYAPVPFDETAWSASQSQLVQPVDPLVARGSQAVVQLWSRGFSNERLSGLAPGAPLSITSTVMKGPDGSVVAMPNATEIVSRDGRERRMWYLIPEASTKPGRYTVESVVSDGTHEATTSASFEWGTLSIDVNGAPLIGGTNVTIGLRSLNGDGSPRCDAEVELVISGPSGYSLTANERNHVLMRNGACAGGAATDPEYLASFTPDKEGSYDVHLARTYENVAQHVEESLSVETSPTVPDSMKKELTQAVSVSKGDYDAGESPTMTIETRKDAVFGMFGVDATDREIRSISLVGPDRKERPVHIAGGSKKVGKSTIREISVANSELVQPGKYVLRVTLTQDGTTYTIEQDFTWGVLAVNIDRSVERPNVDAIIGMAVLDDSGRTLCNAVIDLEIETPAGKIETFSTGQGTVVADPTCVDKGITNNPDYRVLYRTGEPGTYSIRMTAETPNGIRTLEDSFEVRQVVSFDIQRTVFPTRIYPKADYPVSFTVVPSQDYKGPVVEKVPDTFGIPEISNGGAVSPSTDGTLDITWNVDWRAGEPHTLGYTIDFPDISPEFYRLGPIAMGDFHEARQWQIASDATSITVSGTLYSDEGSTVIDCSSANKTVKIEVNASAQYSGTCTASGGTYSIGSVSVEASDVLTIYIDGATENASRTTRVAGTPADITGAHLYQNRVIVSHEDTGPITNTNLDNWDSGNDDDVQYTVTTGALTVVAGSKLIVWTGKTFTPGGTVTTTAASNQSNPDGDVAIQSSATLSMGTNALSVGGDYANSGTFAKSTGQTTTFTGTTTGFTVAPGSSSNFDALTFNGAGGGWTINAAQTVDTTMTLTDGAVTVDGNMTVTTSLSVATNKTLTINSAKTLTLAATSGTSLTLNGTITGAGTLTYMTGTAFPTTGTISSILRMDCTTTTPLYLSARTYGGVVEAYSNTSTNHYVYMGTSASPQQTLNFSSHVYVNAAGSGNYTLLHADNYDPIVNIAGNIDFTGSGAATEYLSIGSGAWTVSGNIDFTSGTVSTNTSNTLTMNGTANSIIGGAQILVNLVIDPVTAGTITAQTSNTIVSGSLTVAADDTLTITGVVVNVSSTASTITLNGTITGTGDLQYRGSAAFPTSGTMRCANLYFIISSTDSIISARTYGVVGVATTNITVYYTSNQPNDHTVTLGTGAGQTITITGELFLRNDSTDAADDAIIDGTTWNPTMEITGQIRFYTPNIAGSTNAEIKTGAGTWNVQGNVNCADGILTASAGNTLKMSGSSTGTLTSNGYTLQNFEINSVGTKTLASATHTIAGNLTFTTATMTPGTSTITMTGTNNTIVGGGETLYNLTIDPASAGIISLNTSDLTVTTLLTVAASDALTISSGRMLTLSRNNATNSLTLNGTINGPGRLTYQNATANAFPTGGTLAATLITRFDTVNGNLNIPARTDYGAIEAYGGSANARTVTLGTAGSQTITTSGYFYVMADAASTNHVTLQGATWDPTLNVGGDFDFTGGGAASEIVTAPDAAVTWTINGNVNLTDGTWSTSAETLQLGGTASAAFDTACTNVTSCTTTKLNNLIINKTAAGDGDDNVTLTTNGVRLGGTLTITDGELVQGSLNIQVEGATAVSIAAAGKWTNVSTGDLYLGGSFTNAGTATFNSNGGTQCANGNDDITISSTTGGTQRAWSNSGTLTIYNVSATDMTDGSITAYTSTFSNTTWTAGICGITVSGVIYNDQEEAYDCSGGSLTIKVEVNGSNEASGTCSLGDGSYSVAGVPTATASVVTIFVDDVSVPAAFITRSADDSTDISADLYQYTNILSHEDAGPITNANIGQYDSSDNSNVPFTMTGSDVDFDAGVKVLDNKTYLPGGKITGDPYVMANANSVVTFDTAGNAISGMYAASGSTIRCNADTAVSGDLALSGTAVFGYSSGSPTVTINGSISGGTGSLSFYNLTFSSGTDTFSGGGTNTIAGSVAVSNGATLTIANTMSVAGSVTTAGTGAVKYSGTPTVTVQGAAIGGGSGNISFYNLTKSGAGTTAWTGTGYNVVRNDLTLSAGTLTAPSGRLIVNNYVQSGGSFTHNSGTLLLNSDTGRTLTSTSDFNNLTLNDGLVGWWTLDEASGTTSADSSGYAHDGTMVNTPTVSTDVPTVNFTDTRSLSFNGSSQYVNIGTQPFVNEQFADKISLSVWIKPTALSGDHAIVSKSFNASHTTPYYHWNLFQSGSAICFRVGTSNTCSGSGALTTGWQHVAGVYDGSHMYLYVNGVQVNSTLVKTGTVGYGTQNARIAARDTTSMDEYFAGNIDDVRIYRRGLSIGEVTVLSGGNMWSMSGATWTLGGALTAAGDLTLMSGTLDTATGSDYAVTVGGSWLNNGGVFTPRSGTVTLDAGSTGKTVTSGQQSFSDLTFNGSGGGWTNSDDLTVSGTAILTDGAVTIADDATVATALSVATDKTLAINSSKTVTLSAASGTSLTLNGTITGAGTLVYQNATAFPTGGTISSALRMDATSVDQSLSARTYGGSVDLYSNSSARVALITMGTGTSQQLDFLGDLTAEALGSLDLRIAASTYSPTVNVAGNLELIGGSDTVGKELLMVGNGTWTVSGNVDFSNGMYAPQLATLNPYYDQTAYYLEYFDIGCVSMGGIYKCDDGESTTLNAGLNDLTTDDCQVNYEKYHYRTGMVFQLNTVSSSSTITGAELVVTVGSASSQTFTVGHAGSDSVNPGTCNTGTETGSRYDYFGPASVYATPTDWNTTGNKHIVLPKAAVVDIQSRLSSEYIGIGIRGDEATETVVGLTSRESSIWPALLVAYRATGTSPTLVMNGASKSLTTGGNGLYNVTFSGTGTTTLNDDVTVFGNATLNSTVSAGTTTLTMATAGTILTGGSATVNNLTIDPVTAGTVTLSGSDLTASGTLTVASGDTLDIATGRIVTNTGTSDAVIAGTVSSSGTGMLRFTDASGGPGTAGTLNATVRFDATSGDISSSIIDVRTYGGTVELYNNSSTSRTITMASGTYMFSSSFNPNAASTGNITIDASTNSPMVNITGDLDFTGSGAGTEYIKAGDGTWTVSGNADFTDGLFAPTFVELSPTWNKIASQATPYTEGGIDCIMGTPTYNCGTTGLEIGLDNQSYGGMTCPAIDTDYASVSKFSTAGISDSALVTSALLRVNVSAANTAYARIIRYATDTPNSDACTGANTGLYMRSKGIDGTILMSPDWTTTGIRTYNIGDTEAVQIQSRLTGSDAIAYAFYDYDMESSVPSAASSHSLFVGYATAATSTLVMNGSGKTLTSAGNGYINLTLSGSISLSGDTFVVANTLDLTGGTITPTSSTIVMSGTAPTIIGGNNTINALTIDPVSPGTVTLSAGGSDLTVNGLLTTATGDTLSVGSGRTLYYSNTGSNMVNNGTLAGTGTLNIPYNSGGIGLLGTVTVPVVFDATNGDSANSYTVRPRTYGGSVTFYNGHASAARSITVPSGTFAYSGTVTVSSPGGGTLTVNLNTNDPTSTISGTLTIGANTTLSANSANALNINGNYANNGTFTHNAGTVTVAGSSQQTFGGTLSGTGALFNNFTITNASGDDPDVSPSVIFSNDLETAGTFTAATPNTKLRFASGGTNTFNAMTLAGSSGNYVALRSSTYGSATSFIVGATRSVTYVSVRDNDACSSSGGSIDASDGNSVNAGNAPCWLIGTLTVSVGSSSLDFGTLSSTTINRTSTTSTVSTSAANGYLSLVSYDHPFRIDASHAIPDATGTITAGISAFGASTSLSGQAISQTDVSCVTGSASSNATALETTFKQFASSSAKTTNETTTLCLLVTPDSSTTAGSYSTNLTLVTTARL